MVVCNTSQVLRMDELANILVNIKPELNLKVVKKQRDSGESYTEKTVFYKNCHPIKDCIGRRV